jgi:recombination protein RecR
MSECITISNLAHMKFSSRILSDAVDTFSRLPGIGKKTALRTILHLAQNDRDLTGDLINSLQSLVDNLKTCSRCHNIADADLCDICSDRSRNTSVLCVVSSVRDVMAIEETNHYRGMYHVLGGVISPIDGVGPDNLNIDTLLDRIYAGDINEVIMAINPTIEGETTIYYLSKKLLDSEVKVTILARGIAFGGELEYADELTLGRSILTRTTYKLSRD